MSDIRQARKALVARILGGPGTASHAQRRAAFEHTSLAAPLGTFVDKLTKHAHEVTDEDIATAKTSGLSEDEIFEIAVCAAVGEATRQYETAFAALDAATPKG
jgi:hypothetical protein